MLSRAPGHGGRRELGVPVFFAAGEGPKPVSADGQAASGMGDRAERTTSRGQQRDSSGLQVDSRTARAGPILAHISVRSTPWR